MIFMGLAMILFLVSFVCSIIIIVDAFKNAVWKGILSFFCGIYLLYYAIAEYNSPNKWMIFGGSLGGLILGYVMMFIGGASSLPHGGLH